MYDGNPGEIDFGSRFELARVRVIGSQLYPFILLVKFTCILITLGIALRQILLHGTARRAEQSLIL